MGKPTKVTFRSLVKLQCRINRAQKALAKRTSKYGFDLNKVQVTAAAKQNLVLNQEFFADAYQPALDNGDR